MLTAGDLENARRAFHNALSLDPEEPSVSLGMARILAWERDWDHVITRLEPVVYAHPSFGPALRLLARAYRETGKEHDLERRLLEESTVEDLANDPLLDVLADRSAPAFIEGDSLRGETLLNRRCSRCHTLDRIRNEYKNRAQWLRTLRRMQTLAGSEWLPDEETAHILAYLSSKSENALSPVTSK